MGRQGGSPESLLDLEPYASDRKAPHDKALVILQLNRHVQRPLLGRLEKVSVDELEVLSMLLFEVVEAVDVHDEPRVSDVVESDVDPATAVVVSFDDEHVVVINEGALLVNRRCRVEGFGVDGFIGCVGVGASQDDRVRRIGEQSIPWGDDESSV